MLFCVYSCFEGYFVPCLSSLLVSSYCLLCALFVTQLLLCLFFSIVNIKSLVTPCILTSDGRNDESIEPILHK